jgi:hypothetical protein
MNNNCESIIVEYLTLLREGFSVVGTDDGCRIVTPTRRPDGESIEIVVQRSNSSKTRLTDEFSTVDYLFLNGLNLDGNHKLYDEAARIARLRGIEFKDSELFIETTAGREAEALDKLIDCIEALTYFIYRRSHREVKSFSDEVELYLAENSVTFNAEYVLHGGTIDHIAPIYINTTKNIVISPLSSTSVGNARHKVKELAFMVQDVKPIMPVIKFNAVLDDRRGAWEKVWSDDIVSKVVNAHMDNVIRWEGRQQLLALVR